jgi:hypothetical protein
MDSCTRNPQFELAKLLSGLGTLDRENAQICGVSIAAVRHWRRGDRRAPGQQGRSEVARCPGCHGRALNESAYGYLPGLYLGDGPQDGPGRKHERKIELEPWQHEIVNNYPGDFARRLFHSDGCRLINRVRRPLKAGTAGMSTRGICS